MKPLTSRVTLVVSMETLDTAPHSRHRDPSWRQSRIRRGRRNTQHHPCQVQHTHTLYTRVYTRVLSLDMDSDGDKSGSGGKSKRGDILRGILKIRRKRNTSVSKAPSRGGYPFRYYYLSMYVFVASCQHYDASCVFYVCSRNHFLGCWMCDCSPGISSLYVFTFLHSAFLWRRKEEKRINFDEKLHSKKCPDDILMFSGEFPQINMSPRVCVTLPLNISR